MLGNFNKLKRMSDHIICVSNGKLTDVVEDGSSANTSYMYITAAQQSP